MSQYPLPYMPPNVTPYYGGPPEALRPARRASVLMFILGPMLLLCGGCVAAFPLLMPMVPPEQLKPLYQQLQNPANISPNVILPVVGAMILLPGMALIVLAFFVRRGGRVSAILSLVLVGLVLLRLVIEVIGIFFHAMDANMALGLCMEVVLHAPFVLLFVWLLNAVRASSTVRLAQQQYQAQYWQYQQNMQAYMGYGQPQQPPAGYPPQGQGYAQGAPPQLQPPPAPPQQIPPQAPSDPNQTPPAV